MLNFHRECWNPIKKHSMALVFFAVSKQIPIVYSADRGRTEKIKHVVPVMWVEIGLLTIDKTKVKINKLALHNEPGHGTM